MSLESAEAVVTMLIDPLAHRLYINHTLRRSCQSYHRSFTQKNHVRLGVYA